MKHKILKEMKIFFTRSRKFILYNKLGPPLLSSAPIHTALIYQFVVNLSAMSHPMESPQ